MLRSINVGSRVGIQSSDNPRPSGLLVVNAEAVASTELRSGVVADGTVLAAGPMLVNPATATLAAILPAASAAKSTFGMFAIGCSMSPGAVSDTSIVAGMSSAMFGVPVTSKIATQRVRQYALNTSTTDGSSEVVVGHKWCID